MQKRAPHILVVGIQKGGVGKTSLSLSLAGAWVAMGYRVGIADFDPQRNATTCLLSPDQLRGGSIDRCLMHGVPMEAIEVPVQGIDGLTIYPGTDSFNIWEELLRKVGREVLLRRANEAISSLVPRSLDVLIVDTPPTLSVPVHFALAAGHSVLVPTEPERLGVEGFGQLVATIDWTRDHVNPDLRVAGIVVNKAAKGTVEHRYWIEQLKKRYGNHVLEPVIPRRVAVAESQSRGLTVEHYPGASRAVKDIFRKLARNVAKRIGLPEPTQLKPLVHTVVEG